MYNRSIMIGMEDWGYGNLKTLVINIIHQLFIFSKKCLSMEVLDPILYIILFNIFIKQIVKTSVHILITQK